MIIQPVQMWNSHHRLLLFFFFVLSVLSFFDACSAETGTATYYKQPYVPSACYNYQDNGVMIAGASNAIWDNRAACGRKYEVRCIGAANTSPHPCRQGVSTVTVKIVDYCPPPYCNGTINLSEDAFARIADLNAGKVLVSFVRV